MSYYNPYQNQGAKTSFGNYSNTSGVGNIGNNRSYAQRAYGGYGGTPRGGSGSYQNPYSQQYNNPQQQQGYQGGGGYRGPSSVATSGGMGGNPFSRSGGGGAMGMGGLGGGLGSMGQSKQRMQASRQQVEQQNSPQYQFDQRMQNMGGMQQAFAAMGIDPTQQQQMFQEYMMPAMGGLFGTGDYSTRQMMGNQNPFQGY